MAVFPAVQWPIQSQSLTRHHPPKPPKAQPATKGQNISFQHQPGKDFAEQPLDFKWWYNFAQNLRIDKKKPSSSARTKSMFLCLSFPPNPWQAAAPLFLLPRKEVLFSNQDLVLMEASHPWKKDCLARTEFICWPNEAEKSSSRGGGGCQRAKFKHQPTSQPAS